jgi:hypothetical protein
MVGTTSDGSTEALTSLISPLEEVPEDKFRRVVCMLEPMRHMPEVRAALEGMRARIAQVRPPRALTVQRLLYMPVEDALVNTPDKSGSGYVSRQLMSIAWSHLESRAEPERLQGWQRRINALTGADSDDEAQLEDEISRWAVEILGASVRRALVDRAERKALLGDAVDLLAEMQQCIRLLDVCPQIRAIRRLLPMKPLRSLGREERSPIRHMILDLQPTSLDRVYAILLAVMLRLAVPGEFLDDVPAILSGFPSAAKAELQSRLTVFIMGDMDRRATTAVQVGDGDLNLRAEKAEILISALAAGEKAILTGDRDTRKQLTAVRGTAVEIVTGIVREADKSVRGGIVADGLGDLDTLKRAEDSVRALRRCDRFADKVGLDGAVRGTIQEVAAVMRTRAAEALQVMQEAPTSSGDSGQSQDEVFWAIRMLELSGCADEADQIRRSAMRLVLRTASSAPSPPRLS